MSPDPVIAQNAAILRQLMEEVSLQGKDMMDRLVAHARHALRLQADKTRDPQERQKLDQALRLLYVHAPQLVASFPQALRDGFSLFLVDKPQHAPEAAPLKFDQLELMDERQVQEKVEAARGLQMAVMAVESELGDFNALICSLLGLKHVQADRNPVRPEIFVQALRKVLALANVEAWVSHQWSLFMGPELGQELRKIYERFRAQMLAQGVRPAGFSVVRSPETSSRAGEHGRAKVSGAGAEASGLTIHQLRKLLAGELEGASLNSAVEVLGEVRQMVKTLDKMGQTSLASDQELATMRAQLRRNAKVESQVLGQEVVNMIIANIAADSRLMPSVQKMVNQLEPALLRLALIDPRFFSDKLHPARVLLEELVERSFTYESEHTPGFKIYLEQVGQTVSELGRLEIADAQPFMQELARLRSGWSREDQIRQQKQEGAKQALMRAEQRNLMAAEIAKVFLGRSDVALVPDDVVRFVVGPWAQVIAHARMNPARTQALRVDYVALVDDLFWSVRPDQARKNVPALVKLIPQLQAGLRQGLKQIEFPEPDTEQFLAALSTWHERSLNPEKAEAGRFNRSVNSGFNSKPVGLTGAGTPWLVPEEARDSGFMEDLEESPVAEAPTDFAATEPMVMPGESSYEASAPLTDLVGQLKVGDWVEIYSSDQWVLVQLAWATPQATLFLFMGSQGRTLSMTRRLLDRMNQEQKIRISKPSTVVDQALDFVASAAMRNSVFMDIQDDSRSQ